MSNSTYIEPDEQDNKKPSKSDKNKSEFKPIPEQRLNEILGILFPWGYSRYDMTQYTGLSPYIGNARNIITVHANDPKWGSVLSICMERFDDESDEDNSLGFYMGIMKVIAPDLHSQDEKFKGNMNILDFYWSDAKTFQNSFLAKITYEPF